MDTLEAIHTRRSIRKYEECPIPKELIEKILSAAMMTPSARNKQPWHFLVIDDREILQKASEINPHARMASHAPISILVCGDLELEHPSGYWTVDCAAAVENLLLAAHALELGAVWTGVYPREERIEGFRQLFNLPAHIMPHSLIVLGYPAEQRASEERYVPERVHWNGWA